MEEIIKSLMPRIPLRLAIPLAVLVFFLLVWPKFREVIRDLSAELRRYERERRRLELIKLRLEIRGLVKQHQLEFDEQEVIDRTIVPAGPVEPEPAQESRKKRSMWGKVGVGALGAVTPSMYDLVFSDKLVISAFHFLLGVSIYAGLGAMIVFITRPATLWRCYFVGFASPISLLILLYILAVMYGLPLPGIPKAH